MAENAEIESKVTITNLNELKKLIDHAMQALDQLNKWSPEIE